MGAEREVELEPGTPVDLTSPRTKRKVTCTTGALLGTGLTGKVYAGTLEDGGQVVLKTQRFAGQLDPALELEARLFKELNHRNVVPCVGLGVARSGLVVAFRRAYPNPLLLMAKAHGAEERRDRRALYPSVPLDAAIDLGYELLNALAYVESRGLVHHDVKLANLLIDVGPRDRPLQGPEVFGLIVRRAYRAVLIDFGAARPRALLDQLARGPVEGWPPPQVTPAYAPPEAVVERRREDGQLGFTFDPTLDVYAAALVIYALITGHPPFSHLERPPAPGDLEALIGVKSAERRGEAFPIAQEVIERVAFEETKFLDGDRQAFELGLFRFLAPRLDRDPAKRGTAADMKREFERLCRIRAKQVAADDTPVRKGAPRVFLPFTQELVAVGGVGEHPLLGSARAYGLMEELDRREHERRQERTQSRAGAAPRRPEQVAGLVLHDAVDDAVSDSRRARRPGRGSGPLPRQPRRADLPTRAFDPKELADAEDEAAPPAGASAAASEPRRARAVPPFAGDHLAFRGEPRQLLALQLAGSLLGLLALAALLLGAWSAAERPLPAWLAPLRGAQALLHSGVARVREVALLAPALPHLDAAARAVPAVAPWAAFVLLLAGWVRVDVATKAFRLRNTWVFKERLRHEPRGEALGALGDMLLLALSAGLAAPWVVARGLRRAYAACSVPSHGQPLGFAGGGLEVLGLALLSLLLLPLGVATLGVGLLAIRYLWLRWEQSRLLVPDREGRLHPTRWRGGLGGYVARALKSAVLSLLTLGLARAWLLVRTWEWTSAQTEVVEE